MEGDGFASLVSPVAGIASGIWITMITAVSFVGNGAVLVLSMRKRKNLKPLDLLTINLAVSDLSVCLIGYPLAAVSGFASKWSFGDSGCEWYGFCGFFFNVSALMTLLALAICRYLKLCWKHLDDRVFAKHMPKILTAIWAYSFLWTFPPLVGWNRYVPERFHTSCTVDWASRLPSDQAYIVCVFLFCFSIPVVGLIGCYGAISKTICTHRKKILRQHKTHFTHFWTEVRLIKSSFAATVAYMIAWTPYAVISFWAFAADASALPLVVSAVPVFVAKSSAVFNPIIYTIFNQKFKSELQELCCCCGCQCYNISININTTISTHRDESLPVIAAAAAAHRSRLAFSNPFSKFLVSPSPTRAVNNKRLFVITGKLSDPTAPDKSNPLGMVINEEIDYPCHLDEDMPGPSRRPTEEARATVSYTLPLVHLPNVLASASSIEGFNSNASSLPEDFHFEKRGSILYAEAQV
ncbi:opsin-5-like [Acanthaster planci]|uniref:Opsin-5-like n=1 Tax=Acanthaster planci TaxID=133434 RepID=A0A8B7Y667_ACAPL|nr:opsin-5-like [Acanthaster planci]